MAIHVLPIPAFRDNYIWLIHDGQEAIVVDPGDAAPVLDILQKKALTLTGILITHHHQDHIGGVAALQAAIPNLKVWASQDESYVFKHNPVAAPMTVNCTLSDVSLQFKVIDGPGHTKGHIAFYAPAHDWLFCGDILFGAGCGRLFEGTPAQMLSTLHKLMALPDETKVFCAHEYTEHNLKFALSLEPEHAVLLSRLSDTQRLRANAEPTIPTTIGAEKSSNPFLRCREQSLKQAIGEASSDELVVFINIRERRNLY